MFRLLDFFDLFFLFLLIMNCFGGTNGTCDTPSQIPNSLMNIIVTPSDQTIEPGAYVVWSCESGYAMAGDADVVVWVCMANGTWFGEQPDCSEITCSMPPAPAFSTIISSASNVRRFKIGETVSYNCHDGYEIIGDSSPITCQSDGSWSGIVPVCQRSCTSSDSMKRYSDHRCFVRYNTDEDEWYDARKECIARGDMLAVIKDDATQTFLQNFLRTISSRDNIWIGGYEGQDWVWATDYRYIELFFWEEPQHESQSDGRKCISMDYRQAENIFFWNRHTCDSNKGVMCQYDSPCNSIQFSSLDWTLDYKESCFKFINDEIPWDDGREICAQQGGFLAEPEDENTHRAIAEYAIQMIHDTDIPGEWWIGGYDTSMSDLRSWFWVDNTRVRYEAWSFRGTSNSHDCMQMRRNSNYLWDDRPCTNDRQMLCQIGQEACADPGAPLHGDRLPSDRTTFPIASEVDFSCDEGYRIIGNSTLKCETNGTWDQMKPRCNAQICSEDPPLVANIHNVTLLSSKYRGVTIYHCREGFIPSAEPTSTCQHDATWSSPNFTCIQIQATTVRSTTFRATSKVLFETTQQPVQQGTFPTGEQKQPSSPAAVASGTVISLLVLIMAVIITVFICKRRNGSMPDKGVHENELEDYAAVENPYGVNGFTQPNASKDLSGDHARNITGDASNQTGIKTTSEHNSYQNPAFDVDSDDDYHLVGLSPKPDLDEYIYYQSGDNVINEKKDSKSPRQTLPASKDNAVYQDLDQELMEQDRLVSRHPAVYQDLDLNRRHQGSPINKPKVYQELEKDRILPNVSANNEPNAYLPLKREGSPLKDVGNPESAGSGDTYESLEGVLIDNELHISSDQQNGDSSMATKSENDNPETKTNHYLSLLADEYEEIPAENVQCDDTKENA